MSRGNKYGFDDEYETVYILNRSNQYVYECKYLSANIDSSMSKDEKIQAMVKYVNTD